jgi:polyhydroxyalkanoate synthesis regulator phasin
MKSSITTAAEHIREVFNQLSEGKITISQAKNKIEDCVKDLKTSLKNLSSDLDNQIMGPARPDRQAQEPDRTP